MPDGASHLVSLYKGYLALQQDDDPGPEVCQTQGNVFMLSCQTQGNVFMLSCQTQGNVFMLSCQTQENIFIICQTQGNIFKLSCQTQEKIVYYLSNRRYIFQCLFGQFTRSPTGPWTTGPRTTWSGPRTSWASGKLPLFVEQKRKFILFLTL